MSIVTANETLYKQPSERRQYSMNFSNLMNTDETIESSTPAPVITSEILGGGASDLTIDTITISGQSVLFWIEGGSNQSRYRIEVLIQTSGGQVLEGDGILVVSDK